MDWRILGLLIAAVFFILPAAAKPAEPTTAQWLHLLNRTSYGFAPGDLAAAKQMGVEAYLQQQLHPERMAEPEDLKTALAALPTQNMTLAEIVEHYGVPLAMARKTADQDAIKEAKKDLAQIENEMQQAHMLRVALSHAQLQEVMTDFWFNHFNVFVEKNFDRVLTGDYERNAIRPHALGKFRDLLEATARHPAMLVYLDNWANIAPTAPDGSGKHAGINENYARELLELHTMGVNGGYTQQDVTQLAYILTGWGLAKNDGGTGKAEFLFEPKHHLWTDKTVLGVTFKPEGEAEVEKALDMLAKHPATAHHISYQLAEYFVSDDPPAALIDTLSKVYLKTDGDIAAVLYALFHAPEFWDPKYVRAKYKSPWHWAASMLRVTQATPGEEGAKLWQNALQQLGERPYHCLTPNGYPRTNDAWLNADALLKRIDIAGRFTQLHKKAAAPLDPDRLREALGNPFGTHSAAAIDTAPPDQQPILIFSSPEFLYY